MVSNGRQKSEGGDGRGGGATDRRCDGLTVRRIDGATARKAHLLRRRPCVRQPPAAVHPRVRPGLELGASMLHVCQAASSVGEGCVWGGRTHNNSPPYRHNPTLHPTHPAPSRPLPRARHERRRHQRLHVPRRPPLGLHALLHGARRVVVALGQTEREPCVHLGRRETTLAFLTFLHQPLRPGAHARCRKRTTFSERVLFFAFSCFFRVRCRTPFPALVNTRLCVPHTETTSDTAVARSACMLN